MIFKHFPSKLLAMSILAETREYFIFYPQLFNVNNFKAIFIGAVNYEEEKKLLFQGLEILGKMA